MRSLALPLGRNKVPGQVKHGGGPDLAHGPCVCRLYFPENICQLPSLLKVTDILSPLEKSSYTHLGKEKTTKYGKDINLNLFL